MVDNSDDILDSRDVIARIAHLAQLEQPGPVDLGDEDNDIDQDTLFYELRDLRALSAEGESLADWEHGVTLVRDSYFEEYARDLAADLGGIHERNQWPATCIDWERAATELQQDYTPIDFDGVTYWGR